jgi:hypothetical protein
MVSDAADCRFVNARCRCNKTMTAIPANVPITGARSVTTYDRTPR